MPPESVRKRPHSSGRPPGARVRAGIRGEMDPQAQRPGAETAALGPRTCRRAASPRWNTAGSWFSPRAAAGAHDRARAGRLPLPDPDRCEEGVRAAKAARVIDHHEPGRPHRARELDPYPRPPPAPTNRSRPRSRHPDGPARTGSEAPRTAARPRPRTGLARWAHWRMRAPESPPPATIDTTRTQVNSARCSIGRPYGRDSRPTIADRQVCTKNVGRRRFRSATAVR